MEDYTYDLAPEAPPVLGAHMLEICPSIAAGTAVAARSIRSRSAAQATPCGSSSPPPPGPRSSLSLVDLGDRFRLVANEVDVVTPPQALPKLPVARAVWKPRPDFTTALEGWLARRRLPPHGRSRRRSGSRPSPTSPRSPASSCVAIDAETRLRELEHELRWNQAYYGRRKGL